MASAACHKGGTVEIISQIYIKNESIEATDQEVFLAQPLSESEGFCLKHITEEIALSEVIIPSHSPEALTAEVLDCAGWDVSLGRTVLLRDTIPVIDEEGYVDNGLIVCEQEVDRGGVSSDRSVLSGEERYMYESDINTEVSSLVTDSNSHDNQYLTTHANTRNASSKPETQQHDAVKLRCRCGAASRKGTQSKGADTRGGYHSTKAMSAGQKPVKLKHGLDVILGLDSSGNSESSESSSPESSEGFLLSHKMSAADGHECRWRRCHKLFYRQGDLVTHVNDVHVRMETDMEYKCDWTGCPRNRKGFNARYKMLIHVRTHTNEKPHKCQLCGKCFSRLENLKIHNRYHTGERPYVCHVDGCNKAYSNSSDRYKHVRTHQNCKPYVCKLTSCNKRYTDPSSLRKHIKTHGHYVRVPRTTAVTADFTKCSNSPLGPASPCSGAATPTMHGTQGSADMPPTPTPPPPSPLCSPPCLNLPSVHTAKCFSPHLATPLVTGIPPPLLPMSSVGGSTCSGWLRSGQSPFITIHGGIFQIASLPAATSPLLSTSMLGCPSVLLSSAAAHVDHTLPPALCAFHQSALSSPHGGIISPILKPCSEEAYYKLSSSPSHLPYSHSFATDVTNSVPVIRHTSRSASPLPAPLISPCTELPRSLRCPQEAPLDLSSTSPCPPFVHLDPKQHPYGSECVARVEYFPHTQPHWELSAVYAD